MRIFWRAARSTLSSACSSSVMMRRISRRTLLVIFVLQAQLVVLAQHFDELVGHVGDLVARELHGVAGVAAGGANHLALRDQRVLDAAEHLLVADALAAHVLAVLAQQVAHLVVQTVLHGQFFGDDFGNFLGHEVGVGGFDDAGRQLS